VGGFPSTSAVLWNRSVAARISRTLNARTWPEPASLNDSCTAARAEGQLTDAELASANGPNRPKAVVAQLDLIAQKPSFELRSLPSNSVVARPRGDRPGTAAPLPPSSQDRPTRRLTPSATRAPSSGQRVRGYARAARPPVVASAFSVSARTVARGPWISPHPPL
jgi:hypothetical protein